MQTKNATVSFVATAPASTVPQQSNPEDLSGAGTSSIDATSTDPISEIGPAVTDELTGAYAQMQQAGTYTASQGDEAAQQLLPLMQAQVSYPTYTAGEITTSPDTSYAGMLAYRSALQVSLKPLLQNTEPEYEIFAYYVETKDPSYLTKLENVAQNYKDAANATAQVTVPADAVPYQIGILNAMQEFGATLDAMATHADDPFASAALLNTYDQAESDMLTSFNALLTYEKSKQP